MRSLILDTNDTIIALCMSVMQQAIWRVRKCRRGHA